MWFTREEMLLITQHQKFLTIRKFRSNGTFPIKVGTKTFLKTGARDKKRYGIIKMVKATVKPLGQMTDADARLGGYDSANEYIKDQMEVFNKGVTLDTEMIFYEFKIIAINDDLIATL